MRTLAIGLVAYGVLGIVIIGLAMVLGGPAITRADRLAGSVNRTLGAATEAADAAGEAFTGFDASLAEARAATSDAATLSREASATLDALAAAMSLSLFGAQPLLPLADDFAAGAEQLGQLGDDMDRVGDALAGNATDVERVAIELQLLADELGELSARVDASVDAEAPPLLPLFYGFLFWQLLPAVAATVGGIWLLRRPAVVVTAS